MPAPQRPAPAAAPAKTLHTAALTAEQADKLRIILRERGWDFAERPYCRWFAQKDRLTAAVYEKGPKIVLQGRGVEEFVQFTLEPEILGEARFGYEDVADPAMYSPHFGIDESGKGDFFGPLVIAGVYVNREIALQFKAAGIQDSKKIGSDFRIRELAEAIRRVPGSVYSVVMIGPERYNELYRKFSNLNRLLAWGHARVIENLAIAQPDCPRTLSDQFANPSLIKRALLEKGRLLQLEQRTKAENDPAVAAASILAREAFIGWLAQAGRTYGQPIGRGVSAQVKTTARALVAAHGGSILNKVAKTHFKTAAEVAPDDFQSSQPEVAGTEQPA